MITYHTPASVMADMGEPTPEQMEEGMKPWMAWAEKCGDKLVDLGAPLTNGHLYMPYGAAGLSHRELSGYSILQAESLEDVAALCDGHPHLSWNDQCQLEIHEISPMPGM